jgi:biotin carboxyl carrier protein
MRLQLKVNDRPYEIDATPLGDGAFSVTVNGRRFETKVSLTDGALTEVTVTGAAHRIELDGAASSGTFEAKANGRSVRVESGRSLPVRRAPAKRAQAVQASPQAAAAEHVPGAVVAPMPGTVIAIDKKPGDAVEHGDRIMTIEAMKMENEIRAEKAGRIKEVRVSVGSSVLAKEVLAVVE